MERSERRRRQAGRILIVVLVTTVLLLLGAHVILAWRLDTSHVQRRLEAAIAEATDSLYLVRIGRSRFSLLGRSFAIEDFELFPDTAAFRRKAPQSHERYLFSARSLKSDGIGLWHFFHRQLWVRSIEIDSLRAEIEVDRTKPRGPLQPAVLPHQALQRSRPLQIDQLHLTNSEVRFFERAIDGTRFGELPFTHLEAVVRNVSNDPLRMSRASACEVDLRARFANAAPLLARFEYDLTGRQLNLSYRGRFGPMDAQALNAFLVDLEGVRIRDGKLESADFNVDVRDDTARGELTLLYHDLAIETLDKDSHHRSLSDKLHTFVFNNFKLTTDNPQHDKPAMVAPLYHPRPVETPLFKFIWITLRDGVFKTLGLR
jgi:hypothetical protein